jgi:hypothetical protein
MENQIINEEFRRMQKLAGLLKEEDSNLSVILYSSWLSNNEENALFFPRIVLYPGNNNLTKENAPGVVDGKRKKGIECMSKVFQVVSEPTIKTKKDAQDFKMTVVKFKKSISEVFIDYGDFDLETFNIIKDIDKASNIVDNNMNQNIETPLSSLVNLNENQDKESRDAKIWAIIDKYNLPDPESRERMYKFFNDEPPPKGASNDTFYGCYVKDIKPNEIISVKEFYQDKAPERF